ncbi:hypothetical protein WA026_011843 [Henosepilachna vigintioctopunctata]|uniref:Complex I-15 kDa n=1 Tax=Henosepilachna vigintioctopunctata TaxID=420089 RepID=A0AAW1UHD1_9CUCU
MSLSPYFKSPFTDLTGSIVNHQFFGKCRKFEERAIDCMEAYGLERGRRECKTLIEDFTECSLAHKRLARFEIMVKERDRQINAGERKKEDGYAPPPVIDSF